MEETKEDEILPEDMIVDESQMNTEPTEAPALGDEQIAQVLSEMKLGVDDYNSLYNALSGVAREVKKSMVTVVGITSDVDWFNNVYESEGAISGIIVADNGRELLILANYSAIKDAEILKICFCDGMEYEAFLKKRDLNTDLCPWQRKAWNDLHWKRQRLQVLVLLREVIWQEILSLRSDSPWE